MALRIGLGEGKAEETSLSAGPLQRPCKDCRCHGLTLGEECSSPYEGRVRVAAGQAQCMIG